MPVHQHCLLLGGSCDLRTELELRRIAPFIKMGSLNWANAPFIKMGSLNWANAIAY
jgi:hypothetical protein